jgi:hypothetical protein
MRSMIRAAVVKKRSIPKLSRKELATNFTLVAPGQQYLTDRDAVRVEHQHPRPPQAVQRVLRRA